MTVNNNLVDVESGSISICEWMWMMTFSEWMMTKHFCRTKLSVGPWGLLVLFYLIADDYNYLATKPRGNYEISCSTYPRLSW